MRAYPSRNFLAARDVSSSMGLLSLQVSTGTKCCCPLCPVRPQVKERLTFSAGKAEAPFQKLQLQIIGAVAQFERAMIRERQREGIAIAKAAGKYKGRKPSFTPEQAELARKMVADGQRKTEVAAHFGVSRTTLYKALQHVERH